MTINRDNRGFTLLEVMLSALLGAFVLLVALAAFRTLSTSRHEQQIYSDLSAQGRYVCRLLRQDLANFYRSTHPDQMKLVGDRDSHFGKPAGHLLFYRVDDPLVSERGIVTGDLFEVEYGLTGELDQPLWLARRVAPVSKAANGNALGILTKIARGITALTFDFYDGKTWQDTWSRTDAFPPMVRINLTLKQTEENIELFFSQEFALEPLPLTDLETDREPTNTP